MTRKEYNDRMVVLNRKLEDARSTNQLGLAMVYCIDIAELGLDHPHYWAPDKPEDETKALCQMIIERAEKLLELR